MAACLDWRNRMQFKKYFTKEQALQKLKQYCAYQERCHQEVREKLTSLGIKNAQRDEIIATLIEENYLNEERFAIAFAGGKFRIKQWGRVKIKQELRQRQVSDYCIKKSLSQIEESEYRAVLQKLTLKKYESLAEAEPLMKKKKTIDYLVGRGFESDWVRETVEGLM